MKQKLYLSHYICLFLTRFLPNERGVSHNTILAYRDTLKLLMRYCNQQLNLKVDKLLCTQIDDEIIRNFLNYLEQQRNSSPTTRNTRCAALKTFFYFLGCEMPECLEISRKISSIPLKKIPHKTSEYLDADELKAIQDSIDINSRNGLRDNALLMLMYNTGARVQEIVNIKISDLRLDAASQVRITGKGNKERVCPLWDETIKVVVDYISVRKPQLDDEEHLFLNDRGVSITRFGIRHIIKKYTGEAIKAKPSLSQKNVNPHTFRHTTAMHLLEAGNELNMVRLWLGHVCLNTTHAYIEISLDMKRQILEKIQSPELKQEKKLWLKPQILAWLHEFC